MSEPEFLINTMNRHNGWCAVICLVGDGQEINTGEAGIVEWVYALERSYPDWHVYHADSLRHSARIKHLQIAPKLHLSTSIRSFRAEQLSDFVSHVIEGESSAAGLIKARLTQYPVRVTRDLEAARRWLRNQRRGRERIGLLASSNAARLKPHGIFVKAKIEPQRWFLAPTEDVRSSDALEDAATEFDVQGLELDWACVCWDANFRCGLPLKYWRFKGSRWEAIRNQSQKRYLANAYRVLLTRARQGVVVFVPNGSDEDSTRQPSFYDPIYAFLVDCGFEPL